MHASRMVFQAHKDRKIALHDAGWRSRDREKSPFRRERPDALFLRCLGAIGPVVRAICGQRIQMQEDGRTNKACNLGTSDFDGVFTLPSVQVRARMGVAIACCPKRQHLVKHTRVQWSCCLHVQVCRNPFELNSFHFNGLAGLPCR